MAGLAVSNLVLLWVFTTDIELPFLVGTLANSLGAIFMLAPVRFKVLNIYTIIQAVFPKSDWLVKRQER